MKFKITSWAVLLLIALFAAGCTPQPAQEPLESIDAAVLDNQEGVLTVARAGNGSDIYTVSISDALIRDEDDQEALPADINTGMLIRIEYAGPVAESYPAQIMNCQAVQILGSADEADLEAAGEALSALAQQFADLGGQFANEPEEESEGDQSSASEPETAPPAEESEAEPLGQESAGTTGGTSQAASVQQETSTAASQPAQSQAPASSQSSSSSTSDSSTGSGGYSFSIPRADSVEDNPERGDYELAQKMLDYYRSYAESQGISWDSSVSRTSFDVDTFVGLNEWEQGIRSQINRYVELGDVEMIWGEILERDDGSLTIRIYR